MKFLKASEAEQVMNGLRIQKGLSADTENKIIEQTVKLARQNGKLGDKIVMVIPPYYVHFPDWQRKLDVARAKEIGENYIAAKWEMPKLIYVGGLLYCIEGMHRSFGAAISGMEDAVFELLDNVTEKEAINIFLQQTADRKRISQEDKYIPSIKAEIPEYLKLRDILHKYNVQIKGDDAIRNPIGIFTSISDGIRTIANDEKTFRRIIAVIYNLGWYGDDCNTAFSSKTFRSLKKLYAAYKGKEKLLETQLLDNCKGAEYFQANLLGRPQCVIFDTLEKAVTNAEVVEFTA